MRSEEGEERKRRERVCVCVCVCEREREREDHFARNTSRGGMKYGTYFKLY